MYPIDFKRKEGGLTYYPPLSAILQKNPLKTAGSFCFCGQRQNVPLINSLPANLFERHFPNRRVCLIHSDSAVKFCLNRHAPVRRRRQWTAASGYSPSSQFRICLVSEHSSKLRILSELRQFKRIRRKVQPNRRPSVRGFHQWTAAPLSRLRCCDSTQ